MTEDFVASFEIGASEITASFEANVIHTETPYREVDNDSGTTIVIGD